MKDHVELYVSEEIRSFVETKVKELKGINRRIYSRQLLFIISRLHWKKIINPTDFDVNGVKIRTFVNSSTYKSRPQAQKGTLGWLFNDSTRASKMLKLLQEWEIIKIKHQSQRGVSARSYVFSERFKDAEAKLEKFYFKDCGAFLDRFVEYKLDQEKNPLIQKLLNIYENYVSVSEDGLQFLESSYSGYPIIREICDAHRNRCFNEKKDTLLEQFNLAHIKNEHKKLLLILTKQFYASIGPQSGRINHNLTNLEKVYRKFLLLNNKPLIETDISNCQPSLAAGIIKAELKNMSHGYLQYPDIDEYVRICREGTFYEKLSLEAGITINNEEDRNYVKKRVYSEVFFCRNYRWKSNIQLAFRRLFPNAEIAIRRLKRLDYRQFAISCQLLESEVMINTVFAKLVEEGYMVLPLHDAIYCYEFETKDYAQKLIRSSLKEKYDLEITFKNERSVVSAETIRLPSAKPLGNSFCKQHVGHSNIYLFPIKGNNKILHAKFVGVTKYADKYMLGCNV